MNDDVKLHDRLVALARRLLERTEDDRVSWSPTDKEDTFLHSGTNASVTIRSFVDRDGDRISTLTIHNSRGTEVESLRSDFSEADRDQWEQEIKYVPAEWNATLDALYYAARRNALKVDELLDELLSEIDNPDNEDDSPPF